MKGAGFSPYINLQSQGSGFSPEEMQNTPSRCVTVRITESKPLIPNILQIQKPGKKSATQKQQKESDSLRSCQASTMADMVRRSLFSFAVIVAGLGLAASSLAANGQDDTKGRGRKYKAPPPTSRVEVTILKDVNGKPIENAAVIFHPMEGGKDTGAMELKTNDDGKAIIDILPTGDTVRLQVIAHGFQTYGEDYKVDKADIAIEIRMKRPGEQYSIYKPHDAAASTDKTTDTPSAKDDAPPATPPPATPPATPPQSN
jgi:hypothetical protein